MSQLHYKQYIYYYDNSDQNVGTSTAAELSTGLGLQFNGPVKHIGVQALPGTKFYLGGNSIPTVVGFLGYIEIDLTEFDASYSSIRFDPTSINLIKGNSSAILIIDTTYLQ